MTAVHDHATVLIQDGPLKPDTRIEVVGFAYCNSILMAIWRDDAGAVHDVPAGALRMEPHVAEVVAG